MAIASLIVTVVAGLGCATAALTYIECVDAAREAARAVARGASIPPGIGPRGASITTALEGERVVATVTVDAGLLPLELRATAIAALEPGDL